MSMDRCDSCNDPIDTDKDDECYSYGRGWNCVCKRCRELEDVNSTLRSCEADPSVESAAISREEEETRSSPIPPNS